MRRLAMTVVTVPAVLALGGITACGGGDGAGREGGGGSVRAVDGPVDMGSLNEVCDGKVALSGAPPYAGPAPHPVMVFSQRQGNDPTGPKLSLRLLEAVSGAEREAFRSLPAQTQLVACAERADRKPTDVVCRFDIGSQDQVPFFRASYRITVREARTGKVVATLPVDPAAAGCPTSVKVAWVGAEVSSAPTDRQMVSALEAFTAWDGAGAPPASAGPVDIPAPPGAPVVQGSVRMATAAEVDPASPVVRDHLAFWAAYAATQEGDRPDFAGLRPRVDRTFLGALTTILDRRGQKAGRSTRGPLHLMVTGVSQEGATAAVDSCVDETGRETTERSVTTGEIGVWYRMRVTLKQSAAGYVATGFADAPPGGCPPPAGKVG